MNPEQLPLRDLHLPPPISWWPPAPGWWMLLLILLGAGLLWHLHRRPRPIPWHSIVEQELEIIRRQYESTPDAPALIRALSALLRRVCMSLYPRRKVAGLTGEAWLAFLDQQAGMEDFRRGGGRVLISAPYQAEAKVDVRALLDVCTAWLRAVTRQSIRTLNKSLLDFSESGNKKRGFCFPPFFSSNMLLKNAATSLYRRNFRLLQKFPGIKTN